MSSDDPPQGESFDERARTLNSNLQRLIEAIGSVLLASGDLLVRLQHLLSGTQAADELPQPSYEDDASPPPDDVEGGEPTSPG